MNIKRYNEIIDDDALYVFDFDDTLVKTPKFDDLVIDYLKENLTIKNLLKSSLNRIHKSESDLEIQDGRVFISDPNQEIPTIGNWVRKGDRVYLTPPNLFNLSDMSLPYELKQTSSIYNEVVNKCIITGRSEDMRNKIIKSLKDLKLDFPKYGLHMCPNGQKKVGDWKGSKIVEIIKETNYNKIIFYEDNSIYLRRAGKVVKNMLPDIIWEPIKVM